MMGCYIMSFQCYDGGPNSSCVRDSVILEGHATEAEMVKLENCVTQQH